ncbi:substrate-binding domain-containing protein [Nocardioides sp.]|uniref:substrate-binding domain-containing protein n=1 Tax=Nocardioides sp. TaxID=35761 RepID=UPI002735E2A5|nr:substrate-binding domain-containing protein [Nocardioides sp.]MDP3894982.1 substrate-binding domain-containing protein [Nocardioides sp.]
MRYRDSAGILLALALICVGLTSCTRTDPVLVTLLLPTAEVPRWESVDEPAFRARLQRTCRGCEYVTHNAEGDVDRQGEQFDAAVRDGADLIVLAPLDAAAAESWVAGTEVPVLAYGTLIAGATYHVSHDIEQVGRLQAESIVDDLDGRGRLLMINGGADDPDTALLKQAAHEVIDASDLEVVDELDPPDGSAEEARDWVADALQQAGSGTIDAIYVAHDAQAGGVAEALQGAGLGRAELPLVTGQGAELDAVRRLVTGEQSMTVHTSLRDQAQQAADIAVAVLANEDVEGGEDHEGLRAWFFEPQAVTLDNLADTVVRDGLWPAAEICQGRARRPCERFGLN